MMSTTVQLFLKTRSVAIVARLCISHHHQGVTQTHEAVHLGVGFRFLCVLCFPYSRCCSVCAFCKLACCLCVFLFLSYVSSLSSPAHVFLRFPPLFIIVLISSLLLSSLLFSSFFCFVCGVSRLLCVETQWTVLRLQRQS
jgi:hypothetical protein